MEFFATNFGGFLAFKSGLGGEKEKPPPRKLGSGFFQQSTNGTGTY